MNMNGGDLDIIFQIGILLFAANIGSAISKKFKQPAVLGQILAGMLMGIFMHETEIIKSISEIGVLFFLFMAGLETDIEELKASGKSSTAIAVMGVIAPMALVSGAAYYISGDIISSLIIGLISIATSVSISVQTLQEIGFLKTKQGLGILGAAIIDDIIGVILLTIIIGIARPAQASNISMVILKILFVFIIIYIVYIVIIKIFAKMSIFQNNIKDKIVGFALVLCFLLAYVSEEFGVAGITGAYFAGIVFTKTPYAHKISHDVQTLSQYFFAPIFFVAIGLGVEFGAIGKGLFFSILMLLLGTIGKIIGCGWGARVTGFTKRQALQIGIGMVPRVEVSLIIANLGLQLSLLSQQLFSAAIVTVIGSTIITPPLLKWSFKKELEEKQDTQ